MKFKQIIGGTEEDVYKKFPWLERAKKFPWLERAKFSHAIVDITGSYLVWQDGIWEDGRWENGIWKNGIWQDGVWERGVWKNGRWEDGIWQDGVWERGVWKNGRWKGGYSSYSRCKWIVLREGKLIRIGCAEKTIEEWGKWFDSDEELETKRGTEAFKRIHNAFLLAKYEYELEGK